MYGKTKRNRNSQQEFEIRWTHLIRLSCSLLLAVAFLDKRKEINPRGNGISDYFEKCHVIDCGDFPSSAEETRGRGRG